ncbi:FMN-binding glutamate synthase family protein [Caldinitratiruptor microaerophilus]|uniref:FMN-binding glutamate synthase family protein n=1 Tax=Caldinitratiruptor microaerophilus TaxID=671077 RepID=A0AA35CN71_9FIRM|nr:FMN-binding glutamate synthase family protein [Caldinitratiruptor microaerophilus]BDG62400.1 FMN-binding glutamate synthase family protein [Caldinitratiruptor microaerophilus]
MWLLAWLLGGAAVLAGAWLLAAALGRRLVDAAVDRALRRLLTEPYHENLWELVTGFGHNPPGPTLENALRARAGRAIRRPIGTGRRFRDFRGLLFRPAQLTRRPLEPDEPVDTRVTIGPQARRPVHLDIPVLLAAMGYGVAVSERVAVALARGAALAGTACNAGKGPLLPAVRREARILVVQYTGTPWTSDPAVLRQADMVEIWFGQGAQAGLEPTLEPGDVPRQAAEAMGFGDDEVVVLPSGATDRRDAQTLRRLVHDLRAVTGGVPIGVKLAAGHDLEADLDVALAAGVDFISLDGAQGGTHAAPPILADDFGLPTLHALCRARRHLDARGTGGRVSLLVGGGLLTPGDCLKCLALGADAVYMGTAALFAATHEQVTRAMPWEPPTELVWATGVLARRFDPARGAESLARFLRAVTDEMVIGARALGKRALRDVNRDDLVALDPETAAITGVPLAYGFPAADAPQADPARRQHG